MTDSTRLGARTAAEQQMAADGARKPIDQRALKALRGEPWMTPAEQQQWVGHLIYVVNHLVDRVGEAEARNVLRLLLQSPKLKVKRIRSDQRRPPTAYRKQLAAEIRGLQMAAKAAAKVAAEIQGLRKGAEAFAKASKRWRELNAPLVERGVETPALPVPTVEQLHAAEWRRYCVDMDDESLKKLVDGASKNGVGLVDVCEHWRKLNAKTADPWRRHFVALDAESLKKLVARARTKGARI
jgi:hypothetical protein